MKNISKIYIFSFIFGIIETILYTLSILLVFSPQSIRQYIIVENILSSIGSPNPLIIILNIFTIRCLYNFYNTSLIANFQASAENNSLRYNFFNFKYSKEKTSASLTKNIINDISDYIYLRVLPLNSIALSTGSVAPFVLILLLQSPEAVIFLCLLFVLILFGFLITIRKRLELIGKIQAISKEKKINAINSFSRNMNIVDHYNYYEKVFSKYRHILRVSKHAFKSITFLTNSVRPLLELIFMAIIIVSYLLSKERYESISDGILIAAVLRVMPAFYTIFTNINLIYAGKEASSSFYKIKDKEIRSQSLSCKNEIKNQRLHKIYIKIPNHERFKFDVKDFEEKFNAANGQYFSISGESGKGKSSLIESIVGLNDIDVILTDQNDKKIKKKDIGYCPQISSMLCNTIDAEIIYGREINYDWLKCIKKILAIEKGFPQIKINGKDNPSMSGGQLQRLALGRSLYGKPKLLILDEATNAISPNMERKILSEIKRQLPNTKLIAIMHRLENEDLFDTQLGIS